MFTSVIPPFMFTSVIPLSSPPPLLSLVASPLLYNNNKKFYGKLHTGRSKNNCSIYTTNGASFDYSVVITLYHMIKDRNNTLFAYSYILLFVIGITYRVECPKIYWTGLRDTLYLNQFPPPQKKQTHTHSH